MKKYKERPCLGRRLKKGENEKGEPIYEEKYTYFSSSEVYNMCLNFSKNIHEKKSELIHKDTYNNIEFDLVGIFANNCTEWVVSDLGCQMDTITTVTLYATLGPNAFKFICEQTEIKTNNGVRSIVYNGNIIPLYYMSDILGMESEPRGEKETILIIESDLGVIFNSLFSKNCSV